MTWGNPKLCWSREVMNETEAQRSCINKRNVWQEKKTKNLHLWTQQGFTWTPPPSAGHIKSISVISSKRVHGCAFVCAFICLPVDPPPRMSIWQHNTGSHQYWRCCQRWAEGRLCMLARARAHTLLQASSRPLIDSRVFMLPVLSFSDAVLSLEAAAGEGAGRPEYHKLSRLVWAACVSHKEASAMAFSRNCMEGSALINNFD